MLQQLLSKIVACVACAQKVGDGGARNSLRIQARARLPQNFGLRYPVSYEISGACAI